jgi:hypothetical protein
VLQLVMCGYGNYSTIHQYELTNLVLDLQNLITSDDARHDVITYLDGRTVSVPKTDVLQKEAKQILKPVHKK